MKLALLLPPFENELWRLARQLGVRYAIAKLHPEYTGEAPPYSIEALAAAQRRFSKGGFVLAGLEGDQFDMSRIKLGKPGADEDLERYKQMVENMGELGIPLLCYNFMAGIGWYRTRTDVAERGGALVSEFDRSVAEADTLHPAAPVSEESIWENYARFLTTVVPVAEKAVVDMALHPDDPPVSPLRGIGRIFTGVAAFDRAYDLAPVASNGVTFCQASFRAMGEELEVAARHFASTGRVKFVHLRDIAGSRDKFRETFHDNGPTDMVRMLKLYKELGFSGLVRPDHVPTMSGERQGGKQTHTLSAGYGTLGRLYAVGYLRGILEAINAGE